MLTDPHTIEIDHDAKLSLVDLEQRHSILGRSGERLAVPEVVALLSRNAPCIAKFCEVRSGIPPLPHQIGKQLSTLILIHVGKHRNRGMRQAWDRRLMRIRFWHLVCGNAVLDIPLPVE